MPQHSYISLILGLLGLWNLGTQAACEQLEMKGGTSTNIKSHPYMASISLDGKFACTGVIVGWKSVLTVASCVSGYDVDNIRVRVGSSFAERGGHLHNVTNTLTTYFYSPVDLRYDMATLTLDKPITLGPSVLPVRIVEDSYQTNQRVKIVGWNNEEGNGQGGMVESFMELVTENDCNSLVKKFDGLSMLCAVKANYTGEPCWGDFGAPMLNQWHALVGLYSWSPSDCSVAVFSNVPRLTNSVRQQGTAEN